MISPRIVSLLPSATEIVTSLGHRQGLVGRSHECDYPAGVEALPVCTRPRVKLDGTSFEIDAKVKEIVGKVLRNFLEFKVLIPFRSIRSSDLTHTQGARLGFTSMIRKDSLRSSYAPARQPALAVPILVRKISMRGNKSFDLRLDRFGQQPACPRPQHMRQGIGVNVWRRITHKVTPGVGVGWQMHRHWWQAPLCRAQPRYPSAAPGRQRPARPSHANERAKPRQRCRPVPSPDLGVHPPAPRCGRPRYPGRHARRESREGTPATVPCHTAPAHRTRSSIRPYGCVQAVRSRRQFVARPRHGRATSRLAVTPSHCCRPQTSEAAPLGSYRLAVALVPRRPSVNGAMRAAESEHHDTPHGHGKHFGHYVGLWTMIVSVIHAIGFVKLTGWVHEYPDGHLAVFHGPRCLARYRAAGETIDDDRLQAA